MWYVLLLLIPSLERTNAIAQLMKKFSAMATIVLPLTLIAGIWGMNVEVPGQTWLPSWLWFWIIIAAMVLGSIFMAIVFRRMRWL